jgi:Fe-Mn family superoxide dismutase
MLCTPSGGEHAGAADRLANSPRSLNVTAITEVFISQLHQLPPLPYALDTLEPDISRETLEYHYGKHHAAYVDKLNKLIENTQYAGMPLEDIVRTATNAIFNNAAQVWNHTFYWHCLSPDGGGIPDNEVAKAIERGFAAFDDFREQFTSKAAGHFGSGWVWLVRQPSGQLEILSTANADTPLRNGATPLLTCDVWEHAYYIDYRNRRADYLQAFWNRVNWHFVNRQFLAAGAQQQPGRAVEPVGIAPLCSACERVPALVAATQHHNNGRGAILQRHPARQSLSQLEEP